MIEGLQIHSVFINIESFDKEKYFPYAAPYWLKHEEKQANTVVICLHGYTATCYEALPIAKSVFQNGMDAIGVLFPAHGLKDKTLAKKAMKNLRYRELLESVRSEIASARQIYDNIFIYGQSMGGAVALGIAEEGIVDACATTAPAIKIFPKSEFLIKLLFWTGLIQKKNDFHDYFKESYQFTELHSAFELVKLGKMVTRNLGKITCPILECHSELDDAVPPKATKIIQKGVKSQLKIRWFNKSGHTMPLDVQGKEVVDTITNFFKANLSKQI